ncbi:MAG: response regulator [Bdellovibrionales bacterium]|nr:response regulator [Bdellovibrionales bacterium]
MNKILIVDDDPISRRIMASALSVFDYDTVQARNGDAALRFIEDNRDVSLIVTDMDMPEISGREFISLLKQDPSLAPVPVIIVSGVVALADISDLLARGASYFVPKPIDSALLREYTLNLLTGRIADNVALSRSVKCIENGGLSE